MRDIVIEDREEETNLEMYTRDHPDLSFFFSRKRRSRREGLHEEDKRR